MTPEQRQEVFDRVCKHLLTQGEKSMKDGECAYRGDDGKMCAVGCLIDDEHYTPDLEGKMVCRAAVRKALEGSLSIPVDLTSHQLLLELQECHDETPPDIWQDALEDIAYFYDLEMKYDT